MTFHSSLFTEACCDAVSYVATCCIEKSNACLLFSVSTTAEQCQLSSPCTGRALRKAASCNPMLMIWTAPKVDNNTQQTTFLLNGCCFQHDSFALWLSVALKLQLFPYWKAKFFSKKIVLCMACDCCACTLKCHICLKWNNTMFNRKSHVLKLFCTQVKVSNW